MSVVEPSPIEKVLELSPYFRQVLQRQPHLTAEISGREGTATGVTRSQLADRLHGRLDGRDDFQAFCSALRRFKQEILLGIALRDLGGTASLRETTRELSDLAQVCLEAATAYCYRDLVKEKGWDPVFLEEKGLLVLGLGKFGGRELNFSSDVDLIFLYRPSPMVPYPPVEQREFYQVLSRRIVQAMGSLIDGDLVFRVDLNLRPGGKDSDLALDLDSAVEYYQTEAKTWERLALIKARPVAGHPLLGRYFRDAVQPIVYRRHMDYSVLEEIRSLKERIMEETRTHLLAGDNIKLGPGGIREIEFVVQSLQLIFGGRLPAVRERNTLKALRKLHQAQILPKGEFQDLVQAYVFLRTLEHRIQMRHQRQTHSLPGDEAVLALIARLMPRPKRSAPLDLESFRRELQHMRNRVQRTFGHLLLSPAPQPQQQLRRFFEGPEPPDPEQALSALGFQNAGAVREALAYWRKRLLSSATPNKERECLTKLWPALLGGVLQAPDPDQSFFFADSYLRRVGGRLGILAMLLERTALVREILTLFSRSALLARLFIQSPEMIERLALRRETAYSFFSDWPAPFPRRKAAGADVEEGLSRLRRWKNEHVLEVALEEMAGRLQPDEASHWLSRLADRVIIETTRMAQETLNREVRPPITGGVSPHQPSTPFCILGLGKLGGLGLGYASDLDVMFIYSLRSPADEADSPRIRSGPHDRRPLITWHEYLVRLAQRLLSYLSMPLPEGPGYSVDTRVRPSGTFGPLVVSLESFREYYRKQAQNWERQMLLKARLIEGPQPLNRQVEDEIKQVLYTAPSPEEVRGEIAYFRGRMETERSGEGPDRINPKLGYGGLTDIEFIVQYLQWLHGVHAHEVRKTDTLEVLQALRAVGALPEKEALSLRESHRFLTSLDHGLQLMLDRREEPRTYTRREIDRLERLNLMGLGEAPVPSWELWKHYRRVTRNLRLLFNEFFSENHKKGRSDPAGKL